MFFIYNAKILDYADEFPSTVSKSIILKSNFEPPPKLLYIIENIQMNIKELTSMICP